MQLSHISTSLFDQFLPYTLKGVAPTSIPQISHMQNLRISAFIFWGPDLWKLEPEVTLRDFRAE